MVTKFESQDVAFLKNEFSKQGEIGQDLSLYEIEDQIASAIEPKWIFFLVGVSKNNELVPIDIEIQSIVHPWDIFCPSRSNSNINKSIY